MAKRMKAAIFVEPGRIVLDEKPVPEPGPLDALMRIGAVAAIQTGHDPHHDAQVVLNVGPNFRDGFCEDTAIAVQGQELQVLAAAASTLPTSRVSLTPTSPRRGRSRHFPSTTWRCTFSTDASRQE